ncbi:hypothetical protein QTP88_002444 [Uroleucon formosanum]
MVLLKTTVVILLAVACVSAANLTTVKSPLDVHQEKPDVSIPAEPTKAPPSGNNITTTVQPTPNKTTTVPPTPKSTTTPIPIITTTTEPPTTSTPNVTTTVKPSSTTLSPNSTTTLSPNVTTAIPSTTTEPSPAPSPARSWDGPSFLGGMVLAFGIVAVGFVGYRFFYLGRGGAYHTL